MCGITGSINTPNSTVHNMMDSLKHRGPDGEGFLNYKNVSLGHRRLAIQDIEGGAQPLEIEGYSIIFNGEIYNHLNLRKKYLNQIDFKSNSDTETLLYLLIKYKDKAFEFIDGMFALCMLDKKNNRLILARDRAGKKPFYFYKNYEKFMFSSELNSLLKGVESFEIDADAINAYLRCGFIYDHYTPFKNIEEVKPGEILCVNFEDLKISRKPFFNILDVYKKKIEIKPEDIINRIDTALRKSVQDRLISSDIEVGAFLSGGIDSSLVVAVASEYVTKLKTFTIKFNGAYDESHLARLTAKKYDTNHHEIQIGFDLERDIEKILKNYGQPFMDSSAIPTYFVSKEAKKYVSVILNGDGADELFGGYRRYVPIRYELLNYIKRISSIQNILPKPKKKQSFYNYFHRLLSLSKKEGLDFYLSSTTDIFEDYISFNKENRILDDLNKKICNSNLGNFDKALYLDFEILLASNLLVKMDISSMANSLETRSPFLSKYFLELIPSISSNYKINKFSTKYILRKIAETYLDPILIKQPKRGFEVPLTHYVNFELKTVISDYLTGESYCSNFIAKSEINKILNDECDVSVEKRTKMLWTLFTLEVWYKNLNKAA